MTDRVNRRDMILDVAARLFVEHGYTATSVRQIAEAVGCTEAALYYHFKDGKRELLNAVLEQNMPDLLGVVEHCRSAVSLHDLIRRFGSGMVVEAQRLSGNRLRWVIAEYPKFSADERKVIHQRAMAFRDGLTEQVRRFVPDQGEAEQLAWMLLFLVFGYGQLMINMDLRSALDFDAETFVESIADRLAAGR